MPAGSAATRSKAPAAAETPVRGRSAGAMRRSAAADKTTPARSTSAAKGADGEDTTGKKKKKKKPSSPSPGKKTPVAKKAGAAGGKTPKTPAGRTPGTEKKGGTTGGKSKKSAGGVSPSRGGGELIHNISFGQNELGADGVVQLYGAIASQGEDPKAVFTMGWMYNFGLGDATKDCRKAVAYYTRAAAMGYEMANYHLGLLQWRGEGTKKNVEGALKNFTVSGEKGNSLALLQLARCYEKGSAEALAVDKKKSKEYYEEAAALGCEVSKKRLASDK